MEEEYKQTFTLTFGDVAENHKGMEMIGEMATNGFTKNNLKQAKRWFKEKGARTKLIKLHEFLPENLREGNEAYVLIIKNGINILLDNDNAATELYNEQNALNKDTKAFMYGRVVNKHARHNLCFSEIGHEANYEMGQGTVIAFDDVPLLKSVRERLGSIIEEMRNLQVEGNYYYDINNCGIGWHGDSERLKVVGVRLGATIPLVYCWFYQNNNITPVINIPKLKLEHGDIYIMSEKATGFDWKKKTRYTLRHAAGSQKYITL
jgi:hypothetical protein